MLFSSMIFLWLFLPFVLVMNLLLPIRLSNFFLLAMSFIFLCMGRAGVYMASPFVPGCELCRCFGHRGCAGQQAGGWGSCWSGRGYGRDCRQYRQPDGFRCRQALSFTPDKLLLVLLVAVNLGF